MKGRNTNYNDWFKYCRLPGINYVYCGLGLLVVTLLWPVLYYWGLPLPHALTARVGGTIGPIVLYIGLRRFIIHTKTLLLLTATMRTVFLLWRLMLLILLAYGIINGNEVLAVIREFIFLWLFSELLIAGVNPLFWHAINPFLTISFYVATPIMLLYYNVPGIVTDELGSDFLHTAEIGGRFTWSLVYEIKSLVASGIFLALWATICSPAQPKLIRALQLIAPLFQFFFTVVLFQFRGGAFIFILATLSFFIIRPLLDHQKVRNTMLILTGGIIGLIIYAQSEAFTLLQYRAFEATQSSGIFESRTSEFADFINDMSLDIVIGRGLGGTFDASNTFGEIQENAHKWGTLHFGMGIFLLKGGFALLILFMYFLVPTRLSVIYRTSSRYHLIAVLYYPIIMFSYIMNPFSLSAANICKYIPIFLMLGILHSRHTGKPANSPHIR